MEVGVLKVLFDKLKNEDERNGNPDKPLFDTVAGTSIGAINAAILVSHVTAKKTEDPSFSMKACWEYALSKLEQFWKYISISTPVGASKYYVKSTHRSGEERTYEQWIKGRFELTKVVRIERRDNKDGISSKFADFTSETINHLIKNGEDDALDTFRTSPRRIS